MPLRRTAFLLALCLSPAAALAQGTVLFVIGSDTGIWDGLDVSTYHCSIDATLYSDPTRNAARVMDPAFREAMVDYYHTPMKLTWWMMAGNMFRLSINTDVPTPSTMPVYLMKRYEGDGLQRWGDELTFHYHDWYWSDENGDAIWYWNQAPAFPVVAAEFDKTLAELLIEEDLFPVSFRSGWHAMDNAWQRRLNEVLPFSMHDDYPSVHADPVEPVDNVYDWSRAPSNHIPFHPSTTDYQLPGDGPGWNLRSQYMSVADSAYMSGIFAAANAGVDQVVCLWAHLPETDFPDNLQKVNRSAHAASGKYPSVPFRYCTAIEAMQRWLRTSDTATPSITLAEYAAGDEVGWTVAVDEPIFQPAPVFAVKDRYEDHRLLPMTQTRPLQWRTSQTVPRSDIAAVAVAVTDVSGNHATRHLHYQPDDIYVDNGDPGYEEPGGTWSTVSLRGWGGSFRSAPVSAQVTPSARWTATVATAGMYSAFLRFPAMSTPADTIRVTVTAGSVLVDTLIPGAMIAGDRWCYLTTAGLQPATPIVVNVTARATTAKTLTADVLRLSPLVKDRWMTVQDIVDLGDLIVGVEETTDVRIQNWGIVPASVLSARTASGIASVAGAFPKSVPAMGSATIQLHAMADRAGTLQDTLFLTTDDPRNPALQVLLTARVHEYFVIVDDGDPSGYQETGSWSNSVAWAYRTTSRYSYPAAANQATFQTVLTKSGRYDISEVVPTTVNATDRAKYVVRIAGIPGDSVFVNQNSGSGSWVHLLTADVHANDVASVTLSDAMSPVIAGRVLRADALRFQWIADLGTADVVHHSALPSVTVLLPNYPNPFNPATRIQFSIQQLEFTRLIISDALGREVAVLVNEEKPAGSYTVSWDAGGFSSGTYFYTLRAGEFRQTKRMTLLK